MDNFEELPLSKLVLQEYLSALYFSPVKVKKIWRLGEDPSGSSELKGFGYGFPYVIEFEINQNMKRVVLSTMRPGGFGHDHFSDRAQVLLWQHSSFNKLPNHVSSVDVGAFENNYTLKSLGNCSEFFILTDFIEGDSYHIDLDNIKNTLTLSDLDHDRCLALSDYLVKIHKLKQDLPSLYVRRIRDLVGHGECIMGLLDSYPNELDYFPSCFLLNVEQDCVKWRWKLKEMHHRLSQVHGDFHPWNLLFRKGIDFTAIDRSRGEWGEPADDVAALTINYLFYSLQVYGTLNGVFKKLFTDFFDNYVNKSGDSEIFEVIQPFYAWRGLVVASPVWYPHLDVTIRVKLLNFVKNVLSLDKFDVQKINSYLEPSII